MELRRVWRLCHSFLDDHTGHGDGHVEDETTDTAGSVQHTAYT